MSVSAEIRLQDSKKKKSRGSVRNADRLQAFASGGTEVSADWGACDAKLLQAVVVGITALSGAVTFGTSRDGGAHSVTLMLESNRKTLWLNGDADLDAELEAVVDMLSQLE